jgi:hypothetical protein
MVKLSVYNIIGREIAVLFEGKMSAGEGRINWPAEDWPGGLYFVVIQAGSEMLVEKLVLLK